MTTNVPKLTLKHALAASRMPFVSASALSVVLATLWVYAYRGEFLWTYSLLSLLGVVLVHLGANTINDYFDWDESDRDNKYAGPFSGGSRVRMEGKVERKHFLLLSAIYFGLALAAAAYLFFGDRPLVLAVGLAGAAGGILYSSPPFSLVSRGVGEIIIFVMFGPLITLGTGYVIEGVFLADHFLIGIPMGLLVGNILWVNQFPDFDADSRAGKRNLVVRLGLSRARWGYAILFGLSVVSVIALAAAGLYPWWSLLFAGLIPLMAKSVKGLWANYGNPTALTPTQASMIQIQTLAGVVLSVALLIHSFVG